MINRKNIKVNFTLLGKGIGVTCITMANAFLPLNTLAQEVSCVNFWTNPNTGKNECFSGEMIVIAEPKPLSSDSSFSDIYNIGGQQISIPNPDRYVRVTKEMNKVYLVHNSTKDPYHKLLASYISQSDVEIAMRGEIPPSSKGLFLKVMKAAEKESTTAQDFAKVKNILKAQNQKIQMSTIPKLQEIVKENSKSISRELGVDLNVDVSQIVPLKPHHESNNIFSYSMYVVSEVSSMGEQTEHVVAGTLTLVNVSGKVVSLYSFGEKEDLEWTQKASLAWAEKVIANNL